MQNSHQSAQKRAENALKPVLKPAKKRLHLNLGKGTSNGHKRAIKVLKNSGEYYKSSFKAR